MTIFTKNLYTGLDFADLRNAFDTVCHQRQTSFVMSTTFYTVVVYITISVAIKGYKTCEYVAIE